jgi:hypothetical protein
MKFLNYFFFGGDHFGLPGSKYQQLALTILPPGFRIRIRIRLKTRIRIRIEVKIQKL